MSVLSGQQTTRMRTRPHRTVAYLAIYEPTTVLAAQIDMPAIVKGEREIDISIISGAAAAIRRGMTVYIGTTPGGKDRGRLRVIEADASSITVAENAKDWIDGWYLTVARYFEPWAVFPRIVLDDNNIPIFYKDFDIAYTDQNQYMDPVVNMGPHHAGFLITGAMSVYYSSSGSFDPTDDNPPTGFMWAFEGGNPTGSNLPNPGWVHYTGAGHFTTELTATTDDGKQLTGYRHVMVYDRPDAGPKRPIVRWGVRSFDGSRDQGGYTLSLFLRERADFNRVKDGALIVIFTETWQGGQRVSVGGNAENRGDILFVGYVESESIYLNAITNQLELRVRSVTGAMESLSTYSATLESKVNAVTWNELRDMTVDKATIHFLRWHSTILQIADFSPTEDNKSVQFIDFGRGNLKETVDEIYESAIGAQAVADRQGKIWAEVDVSLRPTGTRGINTAMDMTAQDWRGEISFEYLDRDELAYLEMGGIAYSGPSTGTFDPYLAGAPGDVAGYFGGVERSSGLVILGQEQLNQLVGLAWARANAEFPEVAVPIAGDYRNLDIAPQERLLLTVEEEETYRGIVWNDKPMIPSEIAYEFRHEQQALLMDVTLREETEGPPGTRIEIPVEPPWDTGTLPEFDIEFPPLIPLLPIPLPTDAPPGPGETVYLLYSDFLARTRNFFDVSPTWELVVNSADLGMGFWGFVIDPHDPANGAMLLGRNGVDPPRGPRIFRTQTLNAAVPTWTETFAPYVVDLLGTNVNQRNLFHLKPFIGRPGAWIACGIAFQLGGGQPTARIVRTNDYGATWLESHQGWSGDNGGQGMTVQPSKHGGYTVYVGQTSGAKRVLRSVDGGVGWQVVDSGVARLLIELPFPGNAGDQIVYASEAGAPNSQTRTFNGGFDWENFSLFWDGLQWAAFDPSNNFSQNRESIVNHPQNGVDFGLLRNGTAAKTLFAKRFGAGGTAWQVLWDFGATVFPLGFHPADESKFYAIAQSATIGTVVGSDDGGLTWFDKTGNLHTAIGIPFASMASRIWCGPAWGA